MTTAENVYAAGDITGDLLFTHAAEYQGRIALQNALFPVRTKIDYGTIPWTTFTDPEVARVGLTERQAIEQHGERARGYTFSFKDLDRALCDGEPHGFAKIVVDKSRKVLGGYVIGPDAGNYISELTLAVKKRMKIGELSTTVHVYPTLAESIKKAADNYNRERLFSGPAPKLLKGYFALKRRFL
jgi:pyruvate/2-oxoglutarate dehydrogenase complex dihydrolipoamide dehydrogenase (E3) component